MTMWLTPSYSRIFLFYLTHVRLLTFSFLFRYWFVGQLYEQYLHIFVFSWTVFSIPHILDILPTNNIVVVQTWRTMIINCFCPAVRPPRSQDSYELIFQLSCWACPLPRARIINTAASKVFNLPSMKPDIVSRVELRNRYLAVYFAHLQITARTELGQELHDTVISLVFNTKMLSTWILSILLFHGIYVSLDLEISINMYPI